MKKAFIEQLLLGFLLAMGIVTFVATVSDETSTRNKIYDLKTLAKTSSQSVARYYEQQMDMCEGQDISRNILYESKLGKQVIDGNLISYKWEDTSGDGQPDRITTTIATLEHSTFWYRFFEKDAFTIGPFTESEDINTPQNVNFTYGGEDAGYTNMVGTYELDSNDCVTNVQLILANSDDNSKVGQSIGSEIQTPPTKVFLMSNGYQNFQGQGYTPGDNDPLNLTQHCFGDTTKPDVSIGATTVSQANIYFEDTELNTDNGFRHIQIIPESIWDLYNDYVNGTGTFSGNGSKTYDEFIAYADGLNEDNDPDNDIDYENDPNGEYQYAMEDLDGGGDEDFNDIFLNSTRVAIPNELNDFDPPDADGLITLRCDTNENPILTIGGCPLTISEDTPSSDITWTATDPDGTIEDTTASASHGTAAVNDNGTITYTPNSNFYGTDTITVQTVDNEDAVGFGYCSVTIEEVNDVPIITGTPEESVLATNLYTFTPSASDADNDVITFTISGKPSWASFDSSTGELSGTPTESNVGIYSDIIIGADDSRGGVAYLPTFSIEVLTNNSAPQVVGSGIPDQSVEEGNTFTYNISNYFTDPDSDTLTYTISGSIGSINSSTGIITFDIPDGLAGTTFNITVTASDGTESVSDTFVLEITSNAECNGPFSTDFNGSTDGWSGGTLHNTGSPSDGYRINGNGNSASRTYAFGPSCVNKNITLTFDYSTRNNWESGEKLDLYINNTNTKTYDQTGDRSSFNTDNTITVQTDTDGNLKVEFRPDTNSNAERAWIDNIELSSQ